MNQDYRLLLESIKSHIESLPNGTLKRGDKKRMIELNIDLIKKASMIFNQKTIIDKLCEDLGIDLSYNYICRVIRNYETKPNKKSLEEKKTEKTRETPKNEPIDKDPFGRKPFPKIEVTEELKKKWEPLGLPNTCVHYLVSHGVSIEEYKKLGLTFTSGTLLMSEVRKYCDSLVSEWTSKQNKLIGKKRN